MSRDLTPEERAEIESLARGGRKIDAIKRHRELTGSSLLDAKNAVEEIVPPPQAAPGGGATFRRWAWGLCILAVLVYTGMHLYIRTKLAGLNLEVVNTGSAALTVQYRSDTFVAGPGKSCKLKSEPGDELVVTSPPSPHAVNVRLEPGTGVVRIAARDDGTISATQSPAAK